MLNATEADRALQAVDRATLALYADKLHELESLLSEELRAKMQAARDPEDTTTSFRRRRVSDKLILAFLLGAEYGYERAERERVILQMARGR